MTMQAPDLPAVDPSSVATTGRITGIDLARALAMGGMIVVHYIWPDDSGGVFDLLAKAMSGRAMPLFMMLGGIGVALSSSRASNPDRGLLVRAVLLFALGIGVDKLSEWVAVVLQFYGLLFAVAPLLRRLSTRILLIAAIVVTGLGGWSYQVFGGFARQPIEYDGLDDPVVVVRALFLDGFYPFFPVAAFFIVGLVIGRLDLRSDRVAAQLLASGFLLGVGAIVGAWAITKGLDADLGAGTVAKAGFDTDRFAWQPLLIKQGHSQMPTWVLSATGSSMLILGASLLIAPRATTPVAPFVSLGRLALTFYVVQVALTKVVIRPDELSYGSEVATAAAIYLGFMVFAHMWLMWFRNGPLEAVLRLKLPGRRPRGHVR